MLPEWMHTTLQPIVPALITVLVFILLFSGYRRLTKTHSAWAKSNQVGIQIGWIILSFAMLVILILSLPISETNKGQLLSLIGIVLSAGLALSSTTIIGNALSGAMLKDLKPGDFIKSGEIQGRVSERGLLHLEIQTEDKNLTVLPNLYLATRPYSIIHSKGTIISCDLSLGYDVDRVKIENTLLEAAEKTGLESAFVLITALGDFSIAYRVSGVLTEIKQRMSATTELHKAVLDSLHDKGIEIVSPNYMNTRSLSANVQTLPGPRFAKEQETALMDIESIVFDKAEHAENLDSLKQKLAKAREGISKLSELSKSADEQNQQSYQQRIDNLVRIKERLKLEIAKQEQQN